MTSDSLFFVASLPAEHHRRFLGQGHLHASNGGEVGCRFVLQQAEDGDITLRCLLDSVQSHQWQHRPRPDSALDWHRDHELLTFDLHTEGHERLENFRFHASGGIAGQTKELDVAQVDLRATDSPDPHHQERPLSHASFFIVNYAMMGAESEATLPSGYRLRGALVALQHVGRQCWLQPVDGHRAIIDTLKESKGIAVTAKIIVPLTSLDEWAEVEAQVDNLCAVLTLLSGNRVSWVSAEAVDTWGYKHFMRLRHAVTNPYTQHDMLNTLANQRTHVWAFTSQYVPIIERMLGHFEDAETNWNIRAAINTWHETVVSDHFPEQRAQLIAGCMEMMRARYLQHGGRATILEPDLFKAQRNAVSKELKKLLKEKFPADDAWSDEQKNAHNRDLSLMYGHVQNLNYYPFNHSLQEMGRALGMMAFAPGEASAQIANRLKMLPLDAAHAAPRLAEDSVKTFVTLRDNLTHYGVFFGAGMSDDGSLSGSVDERWERFCFMQRFVAAFLCSALSWTQPFPAPPMLAELKEKGGQEKPPQESAAPENTEAQ
jgi:hypothetical protein